MIVRDVMRVLDTIAPLRLAEPWDNVGLLLGDPELAVRRVMTCLTLTPEVAAEAIAEQANVVVSHHPILFRGAKSIRLDQPGTDVVWWLASKGISVISHHTAWDSARGGANDCIAQALGLVDVEPMRPAPGPECVKFVVFVPDEYLEAVRAAAFEAGAGHIGLYDQCSFSHTGTGTFRGSDGTNPAIGKAGQREEVAERRLEIVCRKALRSQVMKAIRAAHPYEEPAIDVYALADVALTSSEGVGRVGSAAAGTTIRSLATRAGAGLASSAVQVAFGKDVTADSPVRRVAIACGAGDDLADVAMAAGADVLVSGELRFHTVLKATQSGLSAILVGHHASERMSMEALAARIAELEPGLEVWASRREKEPLLNLERLP